MAGQDDEAEASDEVVEDVDPSSGMRVKRSASASLELFLAEFRRRSAGLSGSDLDAEVDRLVDRIVELHVEAAPRALRDEMRRSLRAMLATDPTIGAMVRELRAAPDRNDR